MATSRAQLAVKNIGKYRTEQEVLENANYSESYARSGLIKRTKGWQELMEKHLPDKKLLKVHKEGLEAMKLSGFKADFKADNEIEEFGHSDLQIPDYPTRHKYLETAYKIKGKLKDENLGETNNFYAVIQNIINEPKGNIIEGRIREVKEEIVEPRVETKQSLLDSRQTRAENITQTEQATDLLTSEPTLQKLCS